MEAFEARVNITYKRQNGDLPDPVRFDSTDGDILGFISEAVRAGSVPGINADPNPDFQDYVIDRFEADQTTPYNRLMARPKTPWGA